MELYGQNDVYYRCVSLVWIIADFADWVVLSGIEGQTSQEGKRIPVRWAQLKLRN
jgi:hypothetical protein